MMQASFSGNPAKGELPVTEWRNKMTTYLRSVADDDQAVIFQQNVTSAAYKRI